eukprot:6185314-Pleurochrysis_carterae.AAC.1
MLSDFESSGSHKSHHVPARPTHCIGRAPRRSSPRLPSSSTRANSSESSIWTASSMRPRRSCHFVSSEHFVKRQCCSSATEPVRAAASSFSLRTGVLESRPDVKKLKRLLDAMDYAQLCNRSQ